MATLPAADVKDLGAKLQAAIGSSLTSTLAGWVSPNAGATPPGTAKPPPADSVVGTIVHAGGLLWVKGISYGIDDLGVIERAGKPDTTTSSVVMLKLVAAGTIEQTNMGKDVWSYPLGGGMGVWLRANAPPPPLTTPTIVPPGRKITLEITDWTDIAAHNTTNGANGTVSNSMPPGDNRTLNGWIENEYYGDPTTGGFNPFSVNADKNLIITAMPASKSKPNPWNKPYNSGCLSWQTLFGQKFGYFSSRMLLPKGKGWWGAYWLLPNTTKYTAELDVIEQWQDGVLQQTMHGVVGGAWASQAQQTLGVDFGVPHDFALDWREDFITCFIDEKQTAKFTTPDGAKEPYYPIYDFAVGAPGSWVTSPDPADAVGQLGIINMIITD